MYRIKSGILAILALAIGQVVGNVCLEKRAFDVFDYVDPLIGTINGGELGLMASIFRTVTKLIECRPCLPWCYSSIW